MVRTGATLPKIADVEEFKRSLLIAHRIVYNQASTGIYLDRLFQRLGVAVELESKTIRYPDFTAVLDHVRNGNGNEIGFGATTVIIESSEQRRAIRRRAAAEMQNTTAYAAALTPTAAMTRRRFGRTLRHPWRIQY